MTLLQDLPGPAICPRGPPPTHPGPSRSSQHPPFWRFQRSLSAPPSGDPRDAAGAGKLNPNSERLHPGTKRGKGEEVDALPAKAGGMGICGRPRTGRRELLSREHHSSAGASSHILGGPVSSATQICLQPRNPEPEDAKSVRRRRDARGKGLASLRPRGFSRPGLPGRGTPDGPQPQSPSLTTALGGVEPKSHRLPVSHVRLQTAVTQTETAAPARRLQGSGYEPAKPRRPGPPPFAPDGARLGARRVRAHFPSAPSGGAGQGSRLARRPVAPRVASAPYLCTLRPRQRQGHKLPAGALAQQRDPPQGRDPSNPVRATTR